MGIRFLCPILFSILFFTYAFLCFSQQVTFEKVVTNIDRYIREPYSAVEFPGVGYLFSGTYLNDTSAVIFCLNTKGDFLWMKKYKGNNISLINPGNSISVLLQNSQGSLELKNLNSEGEETGNISINDTSGKYWTAGGDSYFYLLKVKDDSTVIITKIRYDLDVLWSREQILPHEVNKIEPTVHFSSFQYNNQALFFAHRFGILKFDTEGTLTSHYNIQTQNFIVTPNGRMYYHFGGNIIILHADSSGYLFKDMPHHVYLINYTNDNGLIVSMDSNYYARLDSLGNILWIKQFREMSKLTLPLSDDGFLFVNRFYTRSHPGSFLWVLKTEPDGFYNSINIYYPVRSEHPFNELIAEYITTSEFINAYASYDNKNSWEIIKNNFPGDSGLFKWTPSSAHSVNCYLKIEDSHNPLLYDETDSAFSIFLYTDYNYVAANEILMWAGNNGDGCHDPRTDGNGFYWPKENGFSKSAIFEDGLVWGGIINGEVRFNGNTHRQGLMPGRILPDGKAANPLDLKSRIFKIIKNWESSSSGGEKARLKADYDDWPGEYGAPYYDLDRSGTYSPVMDQPAFIGDEVMYYNSNDLDSGRTKFTYGSLPIGLEIQTTIWAYDSSNYLKDAVFKRYTIINKSSKTIDSMYLGYWADDDMGDANDDYAGCDSSLGLGYTFNSVNEDQIYGTPPPSVGHLLLQGPIIKGTHSDSAKYKNRWHNGFKNLPATAFVFYIGGSAVYRDPQQGAYQGTLEFYNYLKGKLWTGANIINPVTNTVTKFCLNGDPVIQSGWYEGFGWPYGPSPGDRRHLLSTGPFALVPDDTQEVVIAIFMAKGTDYLNSVTELKNTADKLHEFWRTVEIEYDEGEIIPEGYRLYQNYPNPFNPATTIKYELPFFSEVELKVYDILGREAAILVNKYQAAGKYKVEFNSAGLASGVYIYRLKANNYISSKKMLLVK